MYERILTEGWNQLFMTGMAIDGEEAWFSNNIFNGLFRINMRTQEIKFVTTIPNEKIRKPFLYSNCYIWNDYVVVIPAKANLLSVFDKKTQEISQYKIIDKRGETVRGFFSSWQKDNYIYMISSRRPIIARFDVDSRKIDIYSDFDKAIRNRDYNYSVLFWQEVLVEGDSVYIPCRDMNYICKIDLKQNQTKVIEVDTNITGIYTICKCNGKYFISTSKGGVYEIDFCEKETIYKQIGSVAGVFCRSIVIGDDVYFFPKSVKNIYKYSTLRKQMTPCLEDDLHIEDEQRLVARNFSYYSEGYYQMAEKVDDNTWVFMLSDGCLYWLCNGKIHKKGEIFCRKDETPLCILDSRYPEVYEESYDFGNVLGNSLSAFLQVLDNKKGMLMNQRQANFGEKIYESIIGR